MKKTSATRYLELLHGLFIVKDCLKLISEGRDYHIITISGQLRGIFLDTDKEKRKALFFGKHPIKYTLYFHKIENSISTLVKS